MSASAALDMSPQARAEGFLSPVVVMNSAYEAAVAALDDTEEAERLTGLLQSAYFAVHAVMASSEERPDHLRFAVRFGPLADRLPPVELDLLLSEPILVIALPDEA